MSDADEGLDDLAIFLFAALTTLTVCLIYATYSICTFIFHNGDDDDDDQYNNGNLNSSRTGNAYDMKLPRHLTLNEQHYRHLNDWEGFTKLSNVEKLTYLLSVSYCRFNNAKLTPIELSSDNVTTESLLLRDRGIAAFHFQEYYDQVTALMDAPTSSSSVSSSSTSSSSSYTPTSSQLRILSPEEEDDDENDESTPLMTDPRKLFLKGKIPALLRYYDCSNIMLNRNVPYIVEDLIDLNFRPLDFGKYSHSSVLNLPIPTVNRKNNVTYFECKLLQFNSNQTLLSIGLVSSQDYPNFQLPGFIPFSFAIESDGNVRCTTHDSSTLKQHIQSDSDKTIVLPKLNEGDIIGLGYRAISGSIFLTHNGKLIHELVKQFKYQLYPCVGMKTLTPDVQDTSLGLTKPSPCKVSVNLGQLGFVYIEANVKKLGFCENKNEGIIGAPPLYNKDNLKNEIILDKGEEMPPNYNNEESFFGPVVGSSNTNSSPLQEKGIENEEVEVEVKERVTTPVSDPPSYHTPKSTSEDSPEESQESRGSPELPLAVPPMTTSSDNSNSTSTSKSKNKGKGKAKSRKKKGGKKKSKAVF